MLRRSLHSHHRLSKTEEVEEEELYDELGDLQNTHSGWLTKKKSLNRSKEIWCSVSGPWLSFWKDESEQQTSTTRKSKDFIDMTTVQQVIKSVSARTSYGFDLLSSKEKTTLIAKSVKDSEHWIETLQMAMQYRSRAQSIQKSSLTSVTTPEVEARPFPEYEDPFDCPTTPVSQLSPPQHSPPQLSPPQLSPAQLSPLSSLPHVKVPDNARENGSFAQSAAASTPPTSQVAPLYEEIDFFSGSAGSGPTAGQNNSDLGQNAESHDLPLAESPGDQHVSTATSEAKSKPVPAVRTSQRLSAKEHSVPEPKPRGSHLRPMKRTTDSVVLLAPLQEEEVLQGDRNKPRRDTVEISDEDGKRVTVTLRNSSISSTCEEGGDALPTSDDIYNEIVNKIKLTDQNSNRVSMLMAKVDGLKADEGERTGVSFHAEKEADGIRRLREYLGLTPSTGVAPMPMSRTFNKLDEGNHMKAFRELVFG